MGNYLMIAGKFLIFVFVFVALLSPIIENFRKKIKFKKMDKEYTKVGVKDEQDRH